MKTYAPDYYPSFKCIADQCRHSCCIGWDVFIDDDSVCKYEELSGTMGKLIRERISYTDDGPCFVMKSDKKCPFLNEHGLCHLICESGDELLCEICREHPRYYSFFSDRILAGLGLSCEEAARIILSQKEKTHLIVIDNDDEESFELSEPEAYVLEKQEGLFILLQDRSISLRDRIDALQKACNVRFPFHPVSYYANILKSLEHLEDDWNDILDNLALYGSYEISPELEIPYEKLILYFIYRHTSSALDPQDFNARVQFSILSLYTVIALYNAYTNKHMDKKGLDTLCDLARRYSSEIEYSEENTQYLIDMFL